MDVIWLCTGDTAVVENNDKAHSILREAWSEARETVDSPSVTGEHDLV